MLLLCGYVTRTRLDRCVFPIVLFVLHTTEKYEFNAGGNVIVVIKIRSRYLYVYMYIPRNMQPTHTGFTFVKNSSKNERLSKNRFLYTRNTQRLVYKNQNSYPKKIERNKRSIGASELPPQSSLGGIRSPRVYNSVKAEI